MSKLEVVPGGELRRIREESRQVEKPVHGSFPQVELILFYRVCMSSTLSETSVPPRWVTVNE